MGLFGEMEVFLNENSEFDDRETILDLYFLSSLVISFM